VNRAIILLGTNTGNLQSNLDCALQFIAAECGPVIKLSSIYKTAPWGNTDQPFFLNRVIGIDTMLDSRILLNQLLSIETKMGRTRETKWEPRLIDLDILFFNNEIHKEEGLTIPHPHLHERRFTLEPLAEIFAGLKHPVFGRTVRELLSELNDESKVNLLGEQDRNKYLSHP
jgi:2-amino-4-hydroxy-6-hydroxymethyldihydropteridine diphosphokinase